MAHDDLYAQSWNTNFGPNPFKDSHPDNTQDTDAVEYVPVEAPENNHPLPRISKKQWGEPCGTAH